MTTFTAPAKPFDALQRNIASKEASRYYLQFVQFHPAKGEESYVMVATDGHILMGYRVTLAFPQDMPIGIKIAQKLPAKAETIRFDLEDKTATILDKNEATLAILPIETQDGNHYPEWRRILPKSLAPHDDDNALVDLNILARAAACVATTSDDRKTAPVHFRGTSGAGQFYIESRDSDWFGTVMGVRARNAPAITDVSDLI